MWGKPFGKNPNQPKQTKQIHFTKKGIALVLKTKYQNQHASVLSPKFEYISLLIQKWNLFEELGSMRCSKYLSKLLSHFSSKQIISHRYRLYLSHYLSNQLWELYTLCRFINFKVLISPKTLQIFLATRVSLGNQKNPNKEVSQVILEKYSSGILRWSMEWNRKSIAYWKPTPKGSSNLYNVRGLPVLLTCYPQGIA